MQMDSTQRKELKLNFFSCSNDYKEEEVIIVILLSQDDTAEDVLPKFGTPETKLNGGVSDDENEPKISLF